MKMYTLQRKQELPITQKEAWQFFSDPANLKTLTPDYMVFDIIAGEDEEMYPGQIIKYRVAPVAGIRIKWITEITHLKKYEYFVDEQRFGPYSFWHHQHFIREIEGGVEVEDIVNYKLPFGFIGRMAHSLLVKRKLDNIFSYRAQKMQLLFKE